MVITLDESSEKLIQRELERGRFADANEFVAYALQVMEAEADNNVPDAAAEEWLVRNKDGIRAALEESFAAEARGEWYTPEQSQALLEEHRARRRANAA